MSDFDHITPFSLIRGISVAGRANPAICLLICQAGAARAVEGDLLGEIRAQLDGPVHVATASELLGQLPVPLSPGPSIQLVYIDQWLPDLIESLDHKSASLVQDGGQLLLLAEERTAERLLQKAPNLRNRLTGVFQIEPEDLSGGGRA
jgi:hypothetical protein